jgi:hypothetical protein
MFHIGQQVVCVDGNCRHQWDNNVPMPVKGCVYTVRGFHEFSETDLGIYLEEIINKPLAVGVDEPAYFADRFRPVKKTDISTFSKILDQSPTPALEDA